MKVLLENLLRNEDGRTVTKDDIKAVAEWLKTKTSEREIAFRPARVLMQDFTGVPGGGRSRRHARRHEDARRRSQEDQSAGAGRSGHRPFGRGHLLRQQSGVQEERRRGIPAEPGALQIPEMGAALVRQFQRGAARHRHLPSGQSRISVARGLDARRTRSRSTARTRPWTSPIPTRWSAPTRTPPWSTACRCSAGASAASRRKPPCSASRCRWCCPR